MDPRPLVLLLVLVVACSAPPAEVATPSTAADDPGSAASTGGSAPSATESPEARESGVPGETGQEQPAHLRRPAWLGSRVLPRRPDGFGEVQPTPKRLRNRRLATPDTHPPAEAHRFAGNIEPVPVDVLARSTWSADCPVSAEELRLLSLSFWGFDDQAHTGELLVHRSAAPPLRRVFKRMFEARFPIEEMRIVAAEELDAPPTGDGNNTTAFVCRPARGSTSWSQHAYGLAVDINPFHNPYLRGDLVLPELASAYLDRDRDRPGMIQPGDVVTEAFADIGWGWGGDWRSTRDWMHFSANGR